MMYRASHVGQLPRQGICELSIGAPGGVFLLCIYNDDDNNDDNDGANKPLSLAAPRARGLKTNACVPAHLKGTCPLRSRGQQHTYHCVRPVAINLENVH